MTVDAATLQAGDLVIDLGRQRVDRAGVLIELPRLSFDLLVALVRAAPNIVSNEELMSSTWKGLVVSPETVTQRVKLLRDALGDDPKQPRYVEGLRGRGYRMIPEVRVLVPATLTQGALPDSLPIVGRAPGIRWVWILAGITAALLIGWSLLLSNRNASTSTSVSAPGPAAESDRTIAVLPFVTTPGIRDSQRTGRGAHGQRECATGGYPRNNRDLGIFRGADRYGQPRSARDRPGAGRALPGTGIDAEVWRPDACHCADHRQHYRRPALDGAIRSRAGDLFAMQDAVAVGVAQALQSRIAGIDPKIPAGERSANLEAYLAYLRGKVPAGSHDHRRFDGSRTGIPARQRTGSGVCAGPRRHIRRAHAGHQPAQDWHGTGTGRKRSAA